MARYLHGLGFLLAWVLAFHAHAATLMLDTLPDQHALDTFYLPVRVTVGPEECINAVSVDIEYPVTELRVVDVSVKDSILSLWAEPPEVSAKDGRVHFAGGLAGGYCGRIQGDPGKSDILAQLVLTGTLKPEATSTQRAADVRILDTSRVYMHDGRGTEAELSVGTSRIILSAGTSTPNDTWIADVRSDTIAPELFEVTLARSPAAADNRWFIAFTTTDKQSGLDHYEVLETDPDRFGLLSWLPRESHWIEAQSPYVLRDQKLTSKILVKAVDKNGNERVVEYTPPQSSLGRIIDWSLLAFAALALAGALAFVAVRIIALSRRAARARRTEGSDIPYE